MNALAIGFAFFLVLAVAVVNPFFTLGLILATSDTIIKAAKRVKRLFYK